MSKKKRNTIDKKDALELFSAYALKPREINFYSFRLRHEEHDDTFYDWFHTTGAIVRNRDGYSKNVGTIIKPEEVALFIKKDLIK